MTSIQSIINSQQAPQTLIMMSGDQLNKLIEDVVANTRRIVEEQFQPKYFTVDDMMSLFGVSRATIYNWIKRGNIVPYYMEEGGSPYFDQAEIRERMRLGKVGKHVQK